MTSATDIALHDSPEKKEDTVAATLDETILTADEEDDRQIEYDNLSLADSAIGSSLRESTASLTDSVLTSISENGREYHRFKDGKYVLPNDEQEQERLDLQNRVFQLTMEGNLHLAPIGDNPQNVLDIGTGTGIWAIDFSDKYPSARVLGTDLSPVQPSYVPPNVSFEICDAEEEWDFNGKFDYIHGRMLTVCFRDVKQVFQHAFDSLQPGGWLEMQDAHLQIKYEEGTPEPKALLQWLVNLHEGALKLGRPFGTEPPNYERYFKEVGFVDVQVEIRKWPYGPWMKDKRMKELGLWVRANGLDGAQGASMAIFTRGLGWNADQVEKELVGVRKDFMNPKFHSYMDVYIVWGRKPNI